MKPETLRNIVLEAAVVVSVCLGGVILGSLICLGGILVDELFYTVVGGMIAVVSIITSATAQTQYNIENMEETP